MLRSFQITNHKSIRDEVELVLLPTYDRDQAVVPVTGVFGANASGKSNLLQALVWFQSAVLDSYRRWEIDSGVPRVPYRLDATSDSEPSSFVVDIVANGAEYLYGVTLDDSVVREEWLYAYPHGHKRVIFERHGQELVLGSTVAAGRTRAEFLTDLMRPNSLALSVAAQAEQAEALPVYRWFRAGVLAVDAGYPARERSVAAAVGETMAEFPEFVTLLRLADLDITDVVVSDPADDAIPFAQRRLSFRHGPNGAELPWHAQSDGTRTWVRILLPALRALRDGSVLVVDEIDASLHPRLTARLIELFRSATANRNGAQLLFTTHDATLLGTSLGPETLRRDEIWFVEKKDGVSSLYPLSGFRPRKGENWERRYLGGSYGAVPVVFTDSLVDAFDSADEVDTSSEGTTVEGHHGAPA